MDPHERAVSVWYRIAGLISREQKTLAVEIIEAEIRSAQHEVLLEAARLVLSKIVAWLSGAVDDEVRAPLLEEVEHG